MVKQILTVTFDAELELLNRKMTIVLDGSQDESSSMKKCCWGGGVAGFRLLGLDIQAVLRLLFDVLDFTSFLLD